ncbi:YfiT family bacillithiol transferase [Flavobacterium flavipallidum]|uniref:YfiT family bacillithiol transferase n=1 Tax=Flavobacterium flavipallidum TaxID=3139140 RepID=A0ABU9HKI2_9FLAO
MNDQLYDLESLRFPIGEFKKPDCITQGDLDTWITAIECFPFKIKELTKNLPVNEVNWIYRPNGWKIKQVVHHCADSHINSFVRFKLALTEDIPVIKPYEEHLWAELTDGLDDDLTASLQIIEGVHARWVLLLKSFGEQELKKQFIHPATNKTLSLEEVIGVYAWHCNHHLAHIEQALYYRGQF